MAKKINKSRQTKVEPLKLGAFPIKSKRFQWTNKVTLDSFIDCLVELRDKVSTNVYDGIVIDDIHESGIWLSGVLVERDDMYEDRMRREEEQRKEATEAAERNKRRREQTKINKEKKLLKELLEKHGTPS